MSFVFELQGVDKASGARCGCYHTPHGVVHTPHFMPVGTLGSVKGLWHRALRHTTGAHLVLGNTYHLYLRPGLSVMRQAGGVHGFTTWEGPMLTDSGGFQVFSLAGQRKLREWGVEFRSHVDGRRITFTPERVVNIQRVLGADIMMALDECPPGDAPYAYAQDSLQLTLRWLERGYKQYKQSVGLYGYPQAFFPIVQGGSYLDLRRESLHRSLPMAEQGIALGGFAVGEPVETMYALLEALQKELPVHLPRYLMGVGTPWNLLEAIARGVDLFDCVMPTRNGRNGMLFTPEGVMNIRNLKYRADFTPLWGTAGEEGYTRAYLRHLFVAGESLGAAIASLSNVEFYLYLMEKARAHILAGDFMQWMPSVTKRIASRL